MTITFHINKKQIGFVSNNGIKIVKANDFLIQMFWRLFDSSEKRNDERFISQDGLIFRVQI